MTTKEFKVLLQSGKEAWVFLPSRVSLPSLFVRRPEDSALFISIPFCQVNIIQLIYVSYYVNTLLSANIDPRITIKVINDNDARLHLGYRDFHECALKAI